MSIREVNNNNNKKVGVYDMRKYFMSSGRIEETASLEWALLSDVENSRKRVGDRPRASRRCRRVGVTKSSKESSRG